VRLPPRSRGAHGRTKPGTRRHFLLLHTERAARHRYQVAGASRRAFPLPITYEDDAMRHSMHVVQDFLREMGHAECGEPDDDGNLSLLYAGRHLLTLCWLPEVDRLFVHCDPAMSGDEAGEAGPMPGFEAARHHVGNGSDDRSDDRGDDRGDDSDDADDDDDDDEWVHLDEEQGEVLWTRACNVRTGALLLTSSLPALGLDVVTFRQWLDDYLDWVDRAAQALAEQAAVDEQQNRAADRDDISQVDPALPGDSTPRRGGRAGPAPGALGSHSWTA
jgi:hypothetical protein